MQAGMMARAMVERPHALIGPLPDVVRAWLMDWLERTGQGRGDALAFVHGRRRRLTMHARIGGREGAVRWRASNEAPDSFVP